MKRLLKYIFAIAMTFFVVSSASAGKNDNWLLHPTLDLNPSKLVVGDRMVYFLCPAQPVFEEAPENSTPQHFLYRYDFDNKDFNTLTNHNILSETIVKDLFYNPWHNYALALYESGNIDILLDNGRVRNIPGFMNSQLPLSKNVNSVTFDFANKTVYLATDFGFVAIDDKNYTIKDSRIYDRKLLGFSRHNDRYLAITEDGTLYEAPVSSEIYTFDDFSPVESVGTVAGLYPLTETVTILTSSSSIQDENDPDSFHDSSLISLLSFIDEKPVIKELGNYIVSEIEPANAGYLLSTSKKLILINRASNVVEYGIPSEDKDAKVGSFDLKTYWFAKQRKGFYEKQMKNGSLVKTHDVYTPNSSAAFKCTSIEHHPSKGMLVSNHGNDFYFQSTFARSPILLSALKNHSWDKIGPAYFTTNKAVYPILQNPNGLAIDPTYPQYVYFGSTLFGILRLNLNDENDVLHMTGPGDTSLDYYPAAIICEQQNNYKTLNRFSAPHFDASGNLWTMHSNLNSPAGKQNELWVWPRANSAATKDYTDVKPWLKIVPPTSELSNSSICLPLSHSSNKNLVIVSLNSYMGEMVIVDHKGTLDVTSDDTVTTLPLKPVDQDGQTVNRIYVRALYEDPTTGLVWVTTDSGVFTFNPRTAQQNPNLVNRIKVARNDGTSLADYLLNGVDVFNMTSDTQGRKWFATNGAGLVCTSSDGRTVLGEYTTENSGIPSDEVYAAGWNPENGSILISTSLGLAELSPYGAGSGETLDSARAYPNPVRPDFFGWVTIDGLVDNALVKITDAEGNTVRELGNAPGGTVQWDVCDMNMKRVKSGVYYILASSGPNSSSMAKVTKLLVVN